MLNTINPASKYLERKTVFQMWYDNRKTFFIEKKICIDTIIYMEHIAHLICLKYWSLFYSYKYIIN